jgi:uncharacterized protein (TIGR03437 family)
VNFVGNAASLIPNNQLPNGNIAQGAMFVAKGTGLGPATYAVADKFPLQTSIGGTSVAITVGGITTPGIMYYAGEAQVAVILPSSTVTGLGTLTVTYNNKTSAPYSIRVGGFAPGIFTVAQSGLGDAIAFLGPNLISPTNAANPGEIVVLWGTGLGAVSGNETNPAQQVDLTSIPLEVYVGGKSAEILFRGRNGCCSSVDTVYIKIPAGTAGCNTPVVLKVNNFVSNTTSISTALTGRACTRIDSALSTAAFGNLISKGTVSVGNLGLRRSVVTDRNSNVTTKQDEGGASFIKITIPAGALGLSSAFSDPIPGSCSVVSGRELTDGFPLPVQSLDAGSQIGLNGPGGNKVLLKEIDGASISYGATLDAQANYLNPGAYTFTGPGGPGVAAFTARGTLAQPLVWTNQAAITAITRSNGVTVTWSGGDPNGWVSIEGTSFSPGANGPQAFAHFVCLAKTSDGTFSVPPFVLLALPGVASPALLNGSLSVGISTETQVQIPGLDFSSLSFSAMSEVSVSYQ